MAVIKPFICVRPNEAEACQVAALPYDVYNREEAKEVVKKNPKSFLAIDRAETQFDDSVGIYEECVYEKARQLLEERMEDGTFITDQDRCYYVYELTMDGRSQTGIVACASIDDYDQGIIKKHENTREEKEQDRIHHVDTCSAQTGPIFLAYRSNEVIAAEVAKAKEQAPIYDFVSEDGIGHRVWKIAEEGAVAAIKEAFVTLQQIYIADGHHRAASAVKVGKKRRTEHPSYDGTEEFNYFLSVLFPEDQLKILPYNRTVKDLNGLTTEAFLAKIEEHFTVTAVGSTVYEPERKGTFGMYLDEAWYALEAKPELLQITDPVKGLDVSLLQDYLLQPVLGINDPRTDARVEFIGGIRGTKELERRVQTDQKVAFSMYPTSIQELFLVADAGKLMPPKSTWFEPKLRSGLFIHPIERG